MAAVEERGNFARAGEALGLTSSGVSRAVARLEARVGLIVIDKPSPTERVAAAKPSRKARSRAKHRAEFAKGVLCWRAETQNPSYIEAKIVRCAPQLARKADAAADRTNSRTKAHQLRAPMTRWQPIPANIDMSAESALPSSETHERDIAVKTVNRVVPRMGPGSGPHHFAVFSP